LSEQTADITSETKNPFNSANLALSMFDLPLSAISMLSSSWSLPSAMDTVFSGPSFDNHSFHSSNSHNEQTSLDTEEPLPNTESPMVRPLLPYETTNTHRLTQQPTNPVSPVDHRNLDFSSLTLSSPQLDPKIYDSLELYHPLENNQAQGSPGIFSHHIYAGYSSISTSHGDSLNGLPSYTVNTMYATLDDAMSREASGSVVLPSFTFDLPNNVLPEQEPGEIRPPPKILRSIDFPIRQRRRGSATTGRLSLKDEFQLPKIVPLRYSDAKPRDDANIIILWARAEQRGYAEIQKLIHQHTGISMADSTIRGRFRTLTVRPADRQRDVKWTALDVRTAIV
jgi:hypothetical protein